MSPLRDGLALLALSAVAAVCFWWGMRSGKSVLHALVTAKRDTEPTLFWLFQAAIGALALTFATTGLGLVFGFIPD